MRVINFIAQNKTAVVAILYIYIYIMLYINRRAGDRKSGNNN